jgi:signal transduction histidine kinase
MVLLRMLPRARSVAFVPLWDSHRARWFAGSFVWTVQRTVRVLTRTEDLNYLAAFGNSIMAEVARLDVVSTDQAKSDFISSISHELRSPLHGILASVEFLHNTTVDSFQHSMIDTIERCGRTLLDTIQHVLDFAKINTFSRSDRGEKAKTGPGKRRPRPEESSLSVDVDLSLLTEDVVESVFAGHEFQGNSSLAATDEASGFPPEDPREGGTKGGEDGYTVSNPPGSANEGLNVITDIGWRPNWTFNTQSGALRRVLMNLFGNALKYTSKGWVKVGLRAQDIVSTPSQPAQSVITITVSDSGKGIAPEYLHSGLFTPFTQESSLNPGTGLGLSIVLQIVGSLGGTIDITSEQGVGTEVVVTLTMSQASSPSVGREGGSIIQSARKKTDGLTLGLVGFDAKSDAPKRHAGDRKDEPDPSLLLSASFNDMATHWFDMKVTAPQTWKTSPPHVYIANQ